MIVDLLKVPPEGLELRGEDPPEVLGLGERDGVEPLTPIEVRLRVELAGRELVARGSARLRAAFRCVRCTERFEAQIADPALCVALDLDELEQAGRAACGGAEEGADPLRFVDLTPEVRESILLRFPSHPVCRQTCKGLCPQCGANRNVATCACAAPPDPRWGALECLDGQPEE
jgi:uncharacterized protein